MDNQQKILQLLERFEKGLADRDELLELEAWYASFENRAGLTDGLSAHQQAERLAMHLKGMEARLDRELAVAKRPVPLWPRFVAAAAVLVILSIGLYFYIGEKQTGEPMASRLLKEDFAPGGNRAVLTLAGGKRIDLGTAPEGKLASQANVSISKSSSGEIVYDKINKDGVALANTLSTPRGGQYRLRLSDGTMVWLNAASSVSYPASFTGNSREVSVMGEVYFQVAHDPDRPFRVKTQGQVVEVLGTHFDVNAYRDLGSVKTTLVEGSVAVNVGGKRTLIRPGQQAVNIEGRVAVREVEASEELAWKDGYFDFTDADIQTVMEQISRWYDVDVEYVGKMSRETFTGRISRARNISSVLKIFASSSSVELTYKGRRIMVKM